MYFPYCGNYYHILDEDILDIFSKISISFEFFPPKNNSIKNSNFLSSIIQLNKFNPDFISITCTVKNINNHTYLIIKDMKKILKSTIVPHITYINSNKNDIKELARNYWNLGIRNIVALRGDILKKYDNNSVYATNLVNVLKEIENFNIFVAAYPEVHPEANNYQIDLIHLKNKINAGANKIITQFFFNVSSYLRFRDRCLNIGIDVEIIPGILPILDFQQLKKFANMTNVYIPKWIHDLFEKFDKRDLYTNKIIGLYIALDMIKNLYLAGVRKFHFYTLNQFDLLYSLFYLLGAKR